MPQSLANVLLHTTYSTKNRRPLIRPEVEQELYRYLMGICQNVGCPPHAAGGADDHIHLCVSLSRTITIAKFLEEVKKGSSKWIKTKGAACQDFAWQNGYGVFSIGQSGLEALRRYIADQRRHHLKASFQDEFRTLCRKYGVNLDERYAWD
jgi:REP element-mobilizing transposase RayT